MGIQVLTISQRSFRSHHWICSIDASTSPNVVPDPSIRLDHTHIPKRSVPTDMHPSWQSSALIRGSWLPIADPDHPRMTKQSSKDVTQPIRTRSMVATKSFDPEFPCNGKRNSYSTQSESLLISRSLVSQSHSTAYRLRLLLNGQTPEYPITTCSKDPQYDYMQSRSP